MGTLAETEDPKSPLLDTKPKCQVAIIKPLFPLFYYFSKKKKKKTEKQQQQQKQKQKNPDC